MQASVEMAIPKSFENVIWNIWNEITFEFDEPSVESLRPRCFVFDIFSPSLCSTINFTGELATLCADVCWRVSQRLRLCRWGELLCSAILAVPCWIVLHNFSPTRTLKDSETSTSLTSNSSFRIGAQTEILLTNTAQPPRTPKWIFYFSFQKRRAISTSCTHSRH